MILGYIDESGGLGKKDRYFVLALIVFTTKGKRIKRIVKNYCLDNNFNELKGTLLKLPERQKLANNLKLHNDHFVSYIVCDKKNVKKTQLLKEKNLMYNYLSSHLLKRTIKSARDDVYIIFDNHTVKVNSKNSLSDYLKIKAATEWNFNHNLKIEYLESEAVEGIQVADVIANTIYQKYKYGVDHCYNLLQITESIKFPQNSFGK